MRVSACPGHWVWWFQPVSLTTLGVVRIRVRVRVRVRVRLTLTLTLTLTLILTLPRR